MILKNKGGRKRKAFLLVVFQAVSDYNIRETSAAMGKRNV